VGGGGGLVCWGGGAAAAAAADRAAHGRWFRPRGDDRVAACGAEDEGAFEAAAADLAGRVDVVVTDDDVAAAFAAAPPPVTSAEAAARFEAYGA
jgi:hypothetical protein